MIKHLKRYLIAYTQDDSADWDRHLTAAEIAFNNSRQTSTGFTPSSSTTADIHICPFRQP